jgi:hypothetical protein
VTHRKGELLDALSRWVVTAQSLLSPKFRRERVESYTLWLTRDQEIEAAEDAPKTWQFQLTEAITGNRRGCLRSVAVEQLRDSPRSIEVDITPPPGAMEDAAGGGTVPLHFGRIMPQGCGEQPEPQHLDLLWNGDPYGTWTVTLADHDALAVASVAVHLRLAFQ